MNPNYYELIFILIVGLLQPVTEILFGTQIAVYYNGIAALLVLSYVAIRIYFSRGTIIHAWGIRLDNFRVCLLPYLSFAVIAGIGVYVYGWFNGHTPLPVGFWYVLALYPVWGIAQQFVLQNFVAKNLVSVVPSPITRSFVTAVLFACAHVPSVELVVLTFGAGFIFTYIYNYYQNLLALGIAHGILGALVFHLVLGQDQWGILVQYFY